MYKQRYLIFRFTEYLRKDGGTMTKEEIKVALKYVQEIIGEEYGDIYYEHICEVFEEINEKLAFLDEILLYIKADLTDEQYLFKINQLKELVKEMEKK